MDSSLKPARAVIVAAGKSSRLYPLTAETPKGLLQVGGETLLGRSLRLLKESGVRRVSIVTGFRRDRIERAFRDQAEFIYNPFFAETNNMGSLWFAKKWVQCEAFFYLHGDLVYDPTLLAGLEPRGGEAVLVTDPGRADEEAMKVRLDAEGCLLESSKEICLQEAQGEWTGIAAISSELGGALFGAIEELLEQRRFQDYDTAAFNRLARDGRRFRMKSTEGRTWREIDTLEDLEAAREVFREDL